MSILKAYTAILGHTVQPPENKRSITNPYLRLEVSWWQITKKGFLHDSLAVHLGGIWIPPSFDVSFVEPRGMYFTTGQQNIGSSVCDSILFQKESKKTHNHVKEITLDVSWTVVCARLQETLKPKKHQTQWHMLVSQNHKVKARLHRGIIWQYKKT